MKHFLIKSLQVIFKYSFDEGLIDDGVRMIHFGDILNQTHIMFGFKYSRKYDEIKNVVFFSFIIIFFEKIKNFSIVYVTAFIVIKKLEKFKKIFGIQRSL